LNKEIGDGNQAAGIMVAGLFIGIAAIVSGVVA
jgi:putative membrane protein